MKELLSATVRVRPFLEEEAKLIGEAGYVATMHSFDEAVGMLEKEVSEGSDDEVTPDDQSIR